jgi:putative membrane-bound dehydrogenase-like protein
LKTGTVYFSMNYKSVRANVLVAFMPFLVGAAAGAEPPPTGPRSPSAELASFVLADPALTIELAAAEPEVTSPVAIAWDEDGRLFVAEMIDYPVAPAAGRIRRLEDRDGDGRYEYATVFADGLSFPNGVLPCFGGVLVTVAPDILFLRDRDGDGRADEKRVVLTGFGEGNTQLRVNGLSFGMDNRIYAANGRSDGEVRTPNDPTGKAVSIRRRDLRFHLAARAEAPEAIAVEAIAGFSQFGLAHDDWGNRFPAWNTIPLRHVVFEQQTLDRNSYLAETSCIASILEMADGGRIFSISPAQARFNRESVAFFNASCGPIIERGGLLPDAYHGNAFVCEPLSNLVHRRVLEPDGVTFVASRVEKGQEFLASSDPSFRPVNLATGPDGALYIVDMYRELVEHPQFVPESARGTVDFRRWHDRGRIWRVRPRSVAASGGRGPGLSTADTRQLIGHLGQRNGWWRMTAQRLLVERQDHAAVPGLIGMLNDKTKSLGRLHALWTLVALNGLDAAILDHVIGDPHPALREHALRVAAVRELHAPAPLISTARLVKLAADPAIRVRLQTALALGNRCREEPAALEALLKIAAQDANDPWIRLAILSGLAESSLAFVSLCDRIPSASGRAQLLAQAAAIVGVRRRSSELSALLGTISSRIDSRQNKPGLGASIDVLSMLAGLAKGLGRSGPPLHSVIATASGDLKPQLERLAPIWPAASGLAVSDRPTAERLVALDVLSLARPDLAEAIIPSLLAVTQPGEIQSAAARAVGRAGRPSLASKALDRWNDLTLATRRELLTAVAGSSMLAEPLIKALERTAIAPSELDASAREALGRLPDAALRQRASTLLAKFAPPQRSEALTRYQAALELAADERRGAAVFVRNCQTCHQRQGQGHRVGPDLSGIAGRAPDALLIDVLDPNREVAPDYMTLSLATHRGQVVSGLLAEETATTLKLRRAEGIEETILRSEIDVLRSSGRSLMPEGLEQSVSLQEMADLIAFLREGK